MPRVVEEELLLELLVLLERVELEVELLRAEEDEPLLRVAEVDELLRALDVLDEPERVGETLVVDAPEELTRLLVTVVLPEEPLDAPRVEEDELLLRALDALLPLLPEPEDDAVPVPVLVAPDVAEPELLVG